MRYQSMRYCCLLESVTVFCLVLVSELFVRELSRNRTYRIIAASAAVSKCKFLRWSCEDNIIKYTIAVQAARARTSADLLGLRERALPVRSLEPALSVTSVLL